MMLNVASRSCASKDEIFNIALYTSGVTEGLRVATFLQKWMTQ